jgi:hypothetical protein
MISPALNAENRRKCHSNRHLTALYSAASASRRRSARSDQPIGISHSFRFFFHLFLHEIKNPNRSKLRGIIGSSWDFLSLKLGCATAASCGV